MSRKGLGFIFASIVFAAPELALAVPASPDLMELRQPNGQTFIGRLWGDERGHGWETDAGRTVLRDEATGYWHFARLNAVGRLERVAGRPGIEAPPLEVPARVRPAPAVRSRLAASLAAAEEAGPELAVPPSGTGNVPVLLVNFADTSTRFTAPSFQTLLFGTGTFSMRDYYSEVSYGHFTVESGPSGIGGWYTASNGHDYYGADVDAGGDDAWPGDLVYEAAVAADGAGYDFAPYDQDGDCYVDNTRGLPRSLRERRRPTSGRTRGASREPPPTGDRTMAP
jgi:immune inhibitor A